MGSNPAPRSPPRWSIRRTTRSSTTPIREQPLRMRERRHPHTAMRKRVMTRCHQPDRCGPDHWSGTLTLNFYHDNNPVIRSLPTAS